MRFLISGEHHHKSLINALILMFMAYIVMLWISNALMYFHKMSLSPQSVVEYYLGSQEKFTQPISYQSLLEVSHFHFFAMGMLLLTLTHLMLMTDLPTSTKIILSGLTFSSAIVDEIAGWLVRFVHPWFAYLKIAAFSTLELSLAALLVWVSHSLLRARFRHRFKKQT